MRRVIGLPDGRTGERVCVVVASDPSAPPTLADRLECVVDQGNAEQKPPEQRELVDVLPRSPTGKVLKSELGDR
jgi:cyclohexanecarboxylate-CoA ligase